MESIQHFVEDLYGKLVDPTDREYYLFTEIWQKIEDMKGGNDGLSV